MKIPEGWPTEAMIEAGKDARLSITNGTLPGKTLRVIFEAMLAAAPTSPASWIKLREGELIDLANKAAPHNDRDNDLFYITMGRLVENVLNERFQAATPPAQEDEPVYQVKHDGSWDDVTLEKLEWAKKHRLTTRILYTRPQSDELRKAAEDLVNYFTRNIIPGTVDGFVKVQNLRAALVKKS